MTFTTPKPFAEAREAYEVKTLLPTSMTSTQLEDIDGSLLERGRFSAQVTYAEFLEEIDRVVGDILDGKLDEASGRKALQAKARELDLHPKAEDRGTIKDLTGSQRLNLIVGQNVAQARGYGQWAQGQDPAVLDLYPAQELYRARAVKVPRNWASRWSQAANVTRTQTAGFVALKNTPIWEAISRFGTPYPPYDFNSGMRVRDVSRSKAMTVGLIDRDTPVQPESRGFNDDLQFSPEIRSAGLKQALIDSAANAKFSLQFDAAGTLHRVPNPADN